MRTGNRHREGVRGRSWNFRQAHPGKPPWGWTLGQRSEGSGRASLIPLYGRSFQAERMAKTHLLKGTIFSRFGELQRGQRGWRGREGDGARSFSWRAPGTKARDFLQTFAAFTLSEMGSHWGLWAKRKQTLTCILKRWLGRGEQWGSYKHLILTKSLWSM